MIKPADYRDADGWVSSHKIARVIPRPAGHAARVMRHRIGEVPKRKVYQPKGITLYKLSDEQWAAVVAYGVELDYVGGEKRKGWHASDSTCDEQDPVIRLHYKLDPRGYPVAWQWREDSDRAFCAPSVLTLAEAIDQLLGLHPVRLVFGPRYAEQIRSMGMTS